MGFTYSEANMSYANHLRFTVYNEYCRAGLNFYSWIDKRTNKEYRQYTFQTLRSERFTRVYPLWYRVDELTGRKKKQVPNNIGDYIDPVSLAYWIMDDGYYDKSKKTVYLCTECYTSSEIKILCHVLEHRLK